MPRNDDEVRAISVEVYKRLLGPDDARRMLEKDAADDPGDGGRRLAARAGQYDALTRAYLDVIRGAK